MYYRNDHSKYIMPNTYSWFGTEDDRRKINPSAAE